ncbi:hypothetical protein [Amycolatopsis anabasis]|uniref:hypothetical protein n=1 Tax=Amycolatopsis anabasis TaxID=1840409 RepID=UPI00131D02C0|nr:hypothetical protein [Amycolatopsis anabasis]
MTTTETGQVVEEQPVPAGPPVPKVNPEIEIVGEEPQDGDNQGVGTECSGGCAHKTP